MISRYIDIFAILNYDGQLEKPWTQVWRFFFSPYYSQCITINKQNVNYLDLEIQFPVQTIKIPCVINGSGLNFFVRNILAMVLKRELEHKTSFKPDLNLMKHAVKLLNFIIIIDQIFEKMYQNLCMKRNQAEIIQLYWKRLWSDKCHIDLASH